MSVNTHSTTLNNFSKKLSLSLYTDGIFFSSRFNISVIHSATLNSACVIHLLCCFFFFVVRSFVCFLMRCTFQCNQYSAFLLLFLLVVLLHAGTLRICFFFLLMLVSLCVRHSHKPTQSVLIYRCTMFNQFQFK